MAATELAYASVGRLLKFNENPDGTLDFEASKATDPTLDSDAQVADPAWARDAMEAWFATGNGGNLRDMHQPVAAGKALTLEHRDDGEYITGRIVDPISVTKAKHGLYGGLSIGVAGPRIVKDVAAPGGRIVGGRIVEVSLVDVPANPACRLMLAKADGAGNALFVEELVEDVAAPGGRIDKVVGAEPTVVANPDDPDADHEALEKAKKGSKGFGNKKAPPFGADGKPKADDDSDDDSDSEDDDEKKKPAAKAAAPDVDAIVKAVLAELAKQQTTAETPTEPAAPADVVPDGPPVEKAAEPDLVKAADDELDDIARAKRILADLACLVQSEAAGFLGGGGFGEVADLNMLVDVMATLTCFVERETYELEAAAMADNTPAGGDTTPTPTVIQLAAEPDVTKTATAPDLGAALSEQLEKRLKKMRKALAKKAAAEKAAAEPDMTKAATTADTPAETVPAQGLTFDDLTKAIGPVMDRLAEVQARSEALEVLVKSTPRPGGPAVTRVAPVVPSEQLAKAAQVKARRDTYEGMLRGASTAGERAAISALIAELDKPAA